MRRVDLLYMIRNNVTELKEDGLKAEKDYLNDSGLLYDSNYSIDSTKSTVPANQLAEHYQPTTSSTLTVNKKKILTADEIKEVLKSKYILLLHHEESKELRAYYRMLCKNLENNCPSGLSVLDIEKCVDEQNLNNAIHEIYDKADQILLAFSADYSRKIVHGLTSSDASQMVPTIVKLKQMVHSYTNSEYVKNGMKNYRFRIVLFQGTDSQLIPNGWPSNTIVYEFPSNFSELCARLFTD